MMMSILLTIIWMLRKQEAAEINVPVSIQDWIQLAFRNEMNYLHANNMYSCNLKYNWNQFIK